ncbi:MAG: aminopeptidase [Planctomycetes bacterium]|nr:aminopeptidase [Planctomycetota bacterium]
MDPRYQRLAELLVRHSCQVKEGEHLLMELFDVPPAMAVALVEATRAAGGHPHVELRANRVMRALNKLSGEDGLRVWGECDLERMKRMQCYVGIRGADNVSEMSGIAPEQMRSVGRHYSKPVHFDQRVNHTKWVVLRWPSPSMAQLAQMSTEDFERFYFEVCLVDYAKMDRDVQPLRRRMDSADKVHIKGPGATDLRFSIKGIKAVPCCGERNIPDGECFTAPVRDSVEGILQYNTATLYNGTSFTNVGLEFSKGRIVRCWADQNQKELEAIFDTDEGARYVGEFALGFNPHILHPMKDILFDEKIAGSFHFTPGRCYEETENGNRSEIHWDLVCIQRPDYGGGTVSFDGELVRKDGKFVPADLQALNG